MQATSRTTSTALLEALHDPANDAVWREFDQRYRPAIWALARRLGLDHDEAAEVAQETLTQFVRDYPRGGYDRQRGRLSSWIIGIARHRILDHERRAARCRGQRGDSAIRKVPDEARLTEIWTAESQRLLFQRALDELKQSTRTGLRTMLAFELFAINGVPAAAVARQCEMEIAEVYRIKNRLTRRLREIVAGLTDAFEGLVR